MTPFSESAVVPLVNVVGQQSADLFGAGDAAPAEAVILETLERFGPGGLVTVDFEGVRVSSEAARQLLGRALRRVAGGELADRFVVLWRLGSSRYNTAVMLEGEGLGAVERVPEPPGAQLLGRVEPA